MGNYLYDNYEAKMKVSDDVINDSNFFKKLLHNFVSPKKIFVFIQVIFCTNKSPPYHTKFLQIFYNNLNILERDEYFHIVEELHQDLLNQLSFHESFNNFNSKLIDIKAKNPDRSKFNYGIIKPRKVAYEHFFLYTNFHRREFEKIKSKIKLLVEEINTYPQNIENDENIKKKEYTENGNTVTYIGNMKNNVKEGKGILVIKSPKGDTKTYIGEFVNDQYNGLGILKIGDTQFEGNFLENKMDGKIGRYSEKGLEIIEFKNGKQHGRKILYSKDGDISTTSFENDKPTNSYSFYVKASDFLFIAKKLENGLYKGILYGNEEGKLRAGYFNSEFELEGEGFFYFNGGAQYATFHNGNYIPSFSYIIKSDGMIYYGTCNEKGNMHGKNIWQLYYTNDEFKGDLFVGTFIDGERIGYGEYYWGDGDFQKSIYPKGWGIRYCGNHEDKYYFEGYLIKGFPSGPGFLTYEGTKYSGNYDLNGERCLFISNDRKAFKTQISHSGRFNEAINTQFKVEENQ